MLKPKFLRDITRQLEEEMSYLDAKIIGDIASRIVKRLEKSKEVKFSSTDKIQIQILQESGELLEDIKNEIAKQTVQSEKTIADAMKTAGIECIRAENEIYKSAKVKPTKTPWFKKLLNWFKIRTTKNIVNLTATTANMAQKQFIDACNMGMQMVDSGAYSINDAIKEAVNLVGSGVKISYPSGHRDSIEVATARALRTGVSQMTGQMTMRQLEDMDWDIILVSAHLGARNKGYGYENHELWQGQFYTRTGRNPQFPDFVSSTGYGELTGLCGVNCRHSFGAGDGVNNPYVNFVDDPDMYDKEQEQRRLERRIRRLKKELYKWEQALNSAEKEETKRGLEKTVKRKHKALENAIYDYYAYCDENRLKAEEIRLFV